MQSEQDTKYFEGLSRIIIIAAIGTALSLVGAGIYAFRTMNCAQEVTPSPILEITPTLKSSVSKPQIDLNLTTTKLATIPDQHANITRLSMSPDGHRVVYIAEYLDKQIVVVNGKIEAIYDEINPSSVQLPFFSPDGTTLFYKARKGDRWIMVINGEEGKEFTRIDTNSPIFSPNGKRFIYIGSISENEMCIIIDNQEEHCGWRFDVSDSVFSPDSDEYVYRAYLDGQWYYIVNGVRSETDNSFRNRQKEASKSPYDYEVIKEDGKEYVIWNGTRHKSYNSVGLSSPYIVSPDGNRIIYSSRDERGFFMIVDGIESQPYEIIDQFVASPVFSNNSKHYAYQLELKNKDDVLVLDGKEVKIDGKLLGGIHFSDDNMYIAFGVQKDAELWWIVEPVEE